MTMKPAELVADIDRRVRALERTRAALGGGGSGTYLPLAGGTMTGTLTGAGGTFTSLSVNGSTVTTASSLATELASYATTSSLSNYLPLTGGTLTGNLGSPRVNTDLIGAVGGDDLGIGAGETANYMAGNIAGEHLWLGAEGNTYLVTSPDNWASGWAGRYSTTLTPMAQGHLRVASDHGWLELGPQNASWCHIYTDRSAFYFNKYVSVAGGSAVRGTLTLDGKLTANAGITLRSANGVHDSIERVGGVYFTWDSDSYGTSSQHSIRSTNGDTWTDAITVNSYGNIRMNIDSNNNSTSNTFSIGHNETGTGNTLLTLTDEGVLTITAHLRCNEVLGDLGSSTDPSFTFDGDTNTGLYRVANGQLGVTCNGTVHTFKTDGLHLASGDWFRSYGTAGWYSQSYGGGWHMSDTTWLRAYGNKGIYTSAGTIRSDKAAAFMMPNATTTWSYNTVRYNTSNGQLMPYASLGSMKTDITEVQPLLDYLGERSLLYNLRPVIFREADDRTDHEGNPVTTTRGEYAPGFIAEEVHDVAPELTYPDRHGDLISYAPDALVPHVVAELQRLMPMVETLWQAHDPTWTPPTPRPAERADAERAVYELAAEYARTHPLEDPNATVPDDFEDPAAELEVLEDPPTEPTQEDDQTHE
jgi:hypothetical protein